MQAYKVLHYQTKYNRGGYSFSSSSAVVPVAAVAVVAVVAAVAAVVAEDMVTNGIP